MKVKFRFIALIIFNTLFSAHPEDYKDLRLVNGNVLKIKGIAFANDYVTAITDTSTKNYYYSEVDPSSLPESEMNKIRARIEGVYSKSESLKLAGEHEKAARGYRIVLQHKQYLQDTVLQTYLTNGIVDKSNGKILYKNRWMTAVEVNKEKDLEFENEQKSLGKVEYKGSWHAPHELYQAKAKDQAIKLIEEMSPTSQSVRLVARTVHPKFVIADVERANLVKLIDKSVMVLGIDSSKMVSGDTFFPDDLYWAGTLDSDDGGKTIHCFHTDREEAIRLVMNKSKLFDEAEYKRLKLMHEISGQQQLQLHPENDLATDAKNNDIQPLSSKMKNGLVAESVTNAPAKSVQLFANNLRLNLKMTKANLGSIKEEFDGQIVGQPKQVADRFNQAEAALMFDENKSFIVLSSKVIANYSNATIAAWVKSNEGGGKVQTVVSIRRNGGTGGLALRTKDVGSAMGRSAVGFNRTGRSGVNAMAPGAYVTDGRWHLILATSTAKTASIYVDGRLNSTTTFKEGNTASTISGGILIGKEFLYDAKDGFETRSYTGVIDEVYIYDRTLTPQEVWKLYLQTKP